MRSISALFDLRVLVLVLVGCLILLGGGRYLFYQLVDLESPSVPLMVQQAGAPGDAAEPAEANRAPPPDVGSSEVEHVNLTPKNDGWLPPAWLVAGTIFVTVGLLGAVATALMWSRAAAGDDLDPTDPG